MKTLGLLCENAFGGPREAGQHLTTAVTATDMISIIDANQALEKQLGYGAGGQKALLNFWGLSAGTYLGQIVAAMFPGRVGRIILDGELQYPHFVDL